MLHNAALWTHKHTRTKEKKILSTNSFKIHEKQTKTNSHKYDMEAATTVISLLDQR